MDEKRLIKIYANDVRRYPILTKDQEIALVKRIKKGDQAAADLLVSSNIAFVMSMVSRYVGKGMSIADLIQEGNIGLVHAAKTFSLKQKVRFLSYARWAIKSSIVDAFYYKSRLIRVPKHQQLARNKAKFSVPAYLYLNTPDSDTGEEVELPDPTSLESFNSFENKDFNDKLKVQINTSLKRLDKRDTYVLEYNYGLNGKPIKNYRELAQDLGCTFQRIEQVKRRALKRLSNKYGPLKELAKEVL